MREDQAAAMDRAIQSGDEPALRTLLSDEPRLTGTPIPVPCGWGEEMWLPLHRAAERGEAALVAALLEHEASIDSRTRFRTPMHGRETALIIASRCGHAAVVGLLLEHHADKVLLDATHRSALSHAAAKGHGDVVNRLIEAHAALDTADDQQRTALHWAIQGGHARIALALIEAGADVNHRCPKEPGGYTPLHRCMSVGGSMRGVVDRLRQAGADDTVTDPRQGKTADQLAADLAD